MATVQITKITNRTTSKGDPYQNGDCTVDGVAMGFAFWQHPNATQIQAGTTFTVELDGSHASTQVRNGKSQLVLQKTAPIQIVGLAPAVSSPAPAVVPAATVAPAPAPAVAPAPVVAPAKVTSEQIMQRNAALVKVHYDALLAQGFDQATAAHIAAIQAPGDIVPKCWFGSDPEKVL